MTEQALESAWDDYLTALREDAHQLLAWGHLDVRNELPRARDEYDITCLIGDAMDRRINHPETPERFTYYVVRQEHPISPAGERGKDRSKLDVQIVRCGRGPQWTFTFEAKRLRDDNKASASHCVGQYLGKEGLGRFVAGRYAAESLEAAMVGCVQAHDARFWLGLLEKRFTDDVRSERKVFGIIEPVRLESVIPDLRDEATSVHERPNLQPIRLFHIFLDCN